MTPSCQHQWSEETDTCRTCDGSDIGLVEIAENPSTQGYFKVKTEPFYGSYCLSCDDFTMIGLALHCQLCAEVRWLSSMDEDISEV